MNQELYQQTIDFREKTSKRVGKQLSRKAYRVLDEVLWGNLYETLFWGLDKEIRVSLRKEKAWGSCEVPIDYL
jgi:hypothetical protein